MFATYTNKVFSFFFSDARKWQIEKSIYIVAIVAYIIHCLIIILLDIGTIPQNVYSTSNVIPNLLSAIYTPFSIILIYEIYLLIYYLPKSITIYLGKQYEVITLIIIRRIFDKLAYIARESTINLYAFKDLIWTIAGLLILLVLIFLFYKLKGKQNSKDEINCSRKELNYLLMKKVLAILLFITFIILFIGSIIDENFSFSNVENIVGSIKKMSNVFFNTFFSALILTEVLLLLFTFGLTDNFGKVIRNSGFIISTILLKLSFWVTGTTSLIIILIAVGFGVSVLAVYKLYEKKLSR